MDKLYVLARYVDGLKLMVRGLGIGSRNPHMFGDNLDWTSSERIAIQFNKEEAEATLRFIVDVIDYEQDGNLYILEV